MEIYLGHAIYNNFKKQWECRVTVQHDDGHIAKGHIVSGSTKSDVETDALAVAGEFAAEYNTHVLLEG